MVRRMGDGPIYLGTMKAAQGDEPSVRVWGEIVPQLIVCSAHDASPSASTALMAQPSAVPRAAHDASLAGPSSKGRVQSKKRRHDGALNYYVCTLSGCGWRGNSLARHRSSKPSCPGYPSKLTYEKGASVGVLADDFLARCTARQRELGLPPDGAKPIPLAGPDGQVNPSVLYLTVPVGLSAGDTFVVPTGHGFQAKVVVPEGKVEGDVLSIAAHSGKSPMQRREETASYMEVDVDDDE